MKLIFIFLLLILSIQIATAVGFSPSSLTFELETNKEECKMITINSESETINVSDKWASSSDIEWKSSLFKEQASTHSISINYPAEITEDEREVEVCLSGEKAGEYHGIIVLEQEKEGNSIIQLGVWILAIITEPQQSSNNNQNSNNPSSSGGGSSSSSTISSPTISNNNLENQVPSQENVNQENTNPLSRNNQKENQAPITGAVINTSSKRSITIPLLIISAIIIIALIFRRKKQ